LAGAYAANAASSGTAGEASSNEATDWRDARRRPSLHPDGRLCPEPPHPVRQRCRNLAAQRRPSAASRRPAPTRRRESPYPPVDLLRRPSTGILPSHPGVTGQASVGSPSSLSLWSPLILAWPARRHRPSPRHANRAEPWGKKERTAVSMSSSTPTPNPLRSLPSPSIPSPMRPA
jgi:hypothetical protein